MTQRITYTRTVVPPSMRSPYWKHFGFPSDDDDNILTRMKVVCKLCGTAIAYNKNTSNLRTHLMAKHPIPLQQIIVNGNNSSKNEGLLDDIETMPVSKRQRQEDQQQEIRSSICSHGTDQSIIEEVDDGNDDDDAHEAIIKVPLQMGLREPKSNKASNISINDNFSTEECIEYGDYSDVDQSLQNTAIITELVTHNKNMEAVDNNVVEDDEFDNDANEQSSMTDVSNHDAIENETVNNVVDYIAQPYMFADVIISPETSTKTEPSNDDRIYDPESFGVHHTDSASTRDRQLSARQPSVSITASTEINHKYIDEDYLIINSLIADLFPISVLSARSYQHIVGKRLSNLECLELKDKFFTLYDDMQSLINNQLEKLSAQSPYSLGIECYINTEQLEIYNIYFNYYEKEEAELFSVLFQSVRSTEFNLNELLKNFKLSNCAAVVTNVTSSKYASLINEFANIHSIPIVECFAGLITNCLRQIFESSDVTKAFEQLYNASQKDAITLVSMPVITSTCPWSKLQFLEFVINYLTPTEPQLQSHLDDMRELVEFLKPLKITSETIAEETLSSCTLVRPVIVQLFKEHFTNLHSNDDDLLYMAGDVLRRNLMNTINRNSFFNEATFFDARFQHDFIDHIGGDRPTVQESICQRFRQIIEVKLVNQNSRVKNDPNNSADCTASVRKSGLKSLFSRMHNNATVVNGTTQRTKTNIDLEFEKYKCEPTLDLEQCPVLWWQSNEFNYEQLHKVAAFYFSVPCCVSRLFRLKIYERNEVITKRCSLRQMHPEERCLWYLHYNKSYYDRLYRTNGNENILQTFNND